ncbi:cupin domain-containing protein [Microbacterium sp. HD4P20]|uniref:cupin domain-containing protein n=1 Tax=Microbacterium sp. HD4P20 TaxID=2864874 RepID=UPI0020A4A4D0|nr:cupin domain-containing protein [Microbacterium sp. HD4P20]MCP2635160.1 cupin domain-containing protein [Microbacterium sp. HD4P20]
MTAAVSSFPGGTSVTLLDVYEDPAPDGVVGGSPHLHLASTECYVVLNGTGALHTLDLSGAREILLSPGTVAWFTPGTIHRAVNHGDLQVLVIMSNAGLPEAGDAVMTFPAEVVADPERYREAATLPRRATVAERARDAARRRDLAVQGFLRLRAAMVAGDATPLRDFYAAATRLVSDRAHAWESIVRDGPLWQAARSEEMVRAIVAGSPDHLAEAVVSQAPQPRGERGFGMCGRLRAYNVADELVRR